MNLCSIQKTTFSLSKKIFWSIFLTCTINGMPFDDLASSIICHHLLPYKVPEEPRQDPVANWTDLTLLSEQISNCSGIFLPCHLLQDDRWWCWLFYCPKVSLSDRINLIWIVNLSVVKTAGTPKLNTHPKIKIKNCCSIYANILHSECFTPVKKTD